MRRFSIKVLLFLSVCLLFSCSEKKEVDNDLSNNDLVGNVYECTESIYEMGKYDDGSQGEKLSFSNICTYDRNGYLIKYIQYDSENKEKIRYVYKIDDGGNTLEKRFFRPDGSPGFKIFYKYDDNNNLIEEILYDSSDILKESYLHKYNNNKLISSDVKKRDTSTNESYTYIYDSKGNLIRENFYYGIDLEDNIGLNLDHYTIYKYDSNNLIEEVYKEDKTYFREAISLKKVFKYGKDNKWIEQINFDNNGKIEKKVIFKYDKLGKQIEQVKYDSDNNIQSVFKFEYKDIDYKGNWLTYIEYYNNEPSKKTIRKISYY